MKINIFKDNFVENIYAEQKLANHTWFGVGGNAEILYIPEEEKSLEKFLKVKPNDCKVFTIGAGSNLLVRDNGIDGVTLITSKLKKISIDKVLIKKPIKWDPPSPIIIFEGYLLKTKKEIQLPIKQESNIVNG